MRKNYWSCTKLANAIRGTKKPYALGFEEWDGWHDEAKAKHPIRYWIAEEALDTIQKALWVVPDALYSVKYWMLNRFVTKTHALTSTSLKRGQWHELDDRMLHCLFDELVEFVEVELAWKNVAFDSEARAKYKPPFTATGWFRLRYWRSPEAGVDHLNWETSLVTDENYGLTPEDENYGKPTAQAENAKIVLALYNWWKFERPARPEPSDASGWNDWYNNRADRGISFFKRSNEDRDESSKLLDKTHQIEEAYFNEDTEKLIELIKVRRSLWT